nr:MAG TPA: hypothetical protein [Caudoviricetes sp.]
MGGNQQRRGQRDRVRSPAAVREKPDGLAVITARRRDRLIGVSAPRGRPG